MRRLLLATLATHTLVQAEVIMVDGPATVAKKVLTPAVAVMPRANNTSTENNTLKLPLPIAAPPAPLKVANPPKMDRMSNVSFAPVNQWEIKAGESLRNVLDTWCERAGYRLVWNVDGGFRSQGGFVSEEDFKMAVKALFAAIPQDLHLDVDVTKNKLVIVTGGGQ